MSKKVVVVNNTVYADRRHFCTDCKNWFTFSAQEQYHWYVELQFPTYSMPKQCIECRRQRREQKRLAHQLAEALHSLDERDARQLFAIAQIYERMDNAEKAVLFYRRARNLERDEKKRQSMEQHIERLLSKNEPRS